MNNINPVSLPMFFIIGRPRSGTTLLRTLFDAHPNVIIPLECAYINNLHHRYGSAQHFSERSIHRFVEDLKKQKFIFWNVDEARLTGELMAIREHSGFADLCKVVCSQFESAFPKKEILMLGDKNPVYAFYTSRLMKVFPEARFIVLTRDYRDHVVSLLKLKISFHNITQIVWQWKYALKHNLRQIKKTPGRFYQVRYEDLVADPQKVFGEMTRFLGLPYDEHVFDFYNDKQARDKMYTEKFIQQWQQHLFEPISTANSGKWKKELSPRQVMTADAVAGKYAEIAGYQRQYVKLPLAFRLKLWPQVWLSSLYNFRRLLKDRLTFKTENSE